MLPVRDDGIVGDPVAYALKEPLRNADPPEPLPRVLSQPMVGVENELPETVSWLLSDPRAFCGFTEVRRGRGFIPRREHAGRILRVVTDLCDYIVGAILPAPPVVGSVAIVCERPEVDLVASVRILPESLHRDEYQVVWIKVTGECERAVAFEQLKYTFQASDIGFQMKVQVTTIERGNFLKTSESALTGVIHSAINLAPSIGGPLVEGAQLTVEYYREPEDVRWFRTDAATKWVEIAAAITTYAVTPADLGHYIRAEFHVGSSALFAVSAEPIQPLGPVVHLQKDKDAVTEGDVLAPGIQYLGGKEGKSILAWQRNSRTAPKKFTKVADTRTYRVTAVDADCCLRFSYTPVRSDEVVGAKVTLDYGAVACLEPSVRNVKIVQNAQGLVECTGDYSGGVRGECVYDWRVVLPDGKVKSLGATHSNALRPLPQMMGLQVSATYIPVRDDGARGEPVDSANSIVPKPLPAVQSVEILSPTGRLVVGAIVRCRVKLAPAGATARYQWFRGDGASWERINGATDTDYVPEDADAEKFLVCEVEPSNAAGWIGNPVSGSAATAIEPGDPKLLILGSDFTAGTELKTNAESCHWLREEGGEWVEISSGPSYILTGNDVGKRIRAAGRGLASEITPVVVLKTDANAPLKAVVRAKTLKFMAETSRGGLTWAVAIDEVGVSLRAKGTPDKSAKWPTIQCSAVAGTKDEMFLWLDPSAKFVMKPNLSNDPRLAKAVGASVRDFIVVALLQFGASAKP
jgi:hypothetical protein